MSLDQLLCELSVHYRSRGFSESALSHLRWTLVMNTRGKEVISFETAYPGCNRKVVDLLGFFKPEPQPKTTDNPSSTDAVFAFAFGYRMLEWPPGVSPTDPAAVASYRTPGLNNAILAEQARMLQVRFQKDLYLQFEVADAIESSAGITCKSKPIDQGTYAVAKEFCDDAQRNRRIVNRVVIVAHRHHYERCRLILKKDFNIVGTAAPEPYSGYDPFEAQPRVMSPEEYILNDFASMAGMA